MRVPSGAQKNSVHFIRPGCFPGTTRIWVVFRVIELFFWNETSLQFVFVPILGVYDLGFPHTGQGKSPTLLFV